MVSLTIMSKFTSKAPGMWPSAHSSTVRRSTIASTLPFLIASITSASSKCPCARLEGSNANSTHNVRPRDGIDEPDDDLKDAGWPGQPAHTSTSATVCAVKSLINLPYGLARLAVCVDRRLPSVLVAPQVAVMPIVYDPARFWGVVFTRAGSVIPLVFWRSFMFLLVSLVICAYAATVARRCSPFFTPPLASHFSPLAATCSPPLTQALALAAYKTGYPMAHGTRRTCSRP